MISAILLAAGLSKRMGCDKLLLEYNGKTLLQHAVGLLCDLPCEEKILVVTPERQSSVESVDLSAGVSPEEVSPGGVSLVGSSVGGISVVINSESHKGQSESVKLGLSSSELRGSGDFYLFLNADQPRLTCDSLSGLLELAKNHPDKIIYPIVNGAPASPTLFPVRFRGELLELRGDTGGKVVRDAHPGDCVGFEVKEEDAWEFADIDTMEDYQLLGRVATTENWPKIVPLE